jgi:hypothetical protein
MLPGLLPPSRLGAGGVGKTRVALRAAAQAAQLILDTCEPYTSTSRDRCSTRPVSLGLNHSVKLSK